MLSTEAVLTRMAFDPEVLTGKPIVSGLRSSVAMILEPLAKGVTMLESLVESSI